MPVIVGCVKFGSGGILLTAGRKTQSSIVILGLCAAFICLTWVTPVPAQSLTRFKITINSPNEIAVEANLAVPSRSWSFRNAYAGALGIADRIDRSEEHTSELQSQSNLVCRLLLEKKKTRQ